MSAGFRIPLVISLSPNGPEFYNKINPKVIVKIKMRKYIQECEFQSKGLLTSVKYAYKIADTLREDV